MPAALQGAPGYWVAATAGLVVCGGLLVTFMGWVLKQQLRTHAARP